MSRSALVLYGRIGTYNKRTANMKSTEKADLKMWKSAAVSTMKNIIQYWKSFNISVNVFIQSWNRELKNEMETFWKPANSTYMSQHDNIEQVCKTTLRKSSYCQRTLWTARAIVVAIGLIPDLLCYDSIMMMRHDVRWLHPLPPVQITTNTRLWLPMECVRCSQNICSSFPQRYTISSSSPCSGPKCLETIQVDWWWIADPTLLLNLNNIYSNYSYYGTRMNDVLHKRELTPHQLFGIYFFHTQKLSRCNIGYVASKPWHFRLARFRHRITSCVPHVRGVISKTVPCNNNQINLQCAYMHNTRLPCTSNVSFY